MKLLPTLIIATAFPIMAAGQSTTLANVDSAGIQGNGGSVEPSISADGRYVAFYSHSTNLVGGDTNAWPDVFVHDRQTGQTTRVSVDSLGLQGNLESREPSISADGRYVAFESAATNLVGGDTNGASDVFIHDRQTGQTTRVSVDSSGIQGNSGSYDPSISADGRFVAFDSTATNLAGGDTNGASDVFIHDRQTGQTTRVSISSAGAQGNHYSSYPTISADSRYVAFHSTATNLVALPDTNFSADVFVHDRQMGQTTRVSVSSGGILGNGGSERASISADGRYVAFFSHSTNLVGGDTNGASDVFIHDRQTGQTTRVSVDSWGIQGNSSSSLPSISADGRCVAFGSRATNLVLGDTNGYYDVFVHDQQMGQTTRVSISSVGLQGNFDANYASISADGHHVAFESGATNLVPGGTTATGTFVHNRFGPSLTKVGVCPGSMTFVASGAAPGGSAAFVWGTAGSFVIPASYPCVGTQLDLVPLLTPTPGYLLATADSSAIATLTANVPAGGCGLLVMQAVDLSTCATTNTMSF